MPFSPFIVKPTTAKFNGTGFGASLAKTKTRQARLLLLVDRATAERLGWTARLHLAVLLGDGEQHGILRMRPESDGTAEVVAKKARGGVFFQINLGHIDSFVDRREPKKWCQFEPVEDGWTEIVLPSWADETGPAKRQRVAALPHHNPLALALPARASADRLPGDPPPGRSALDQRQRPVERTKAEARQMAEARETSEYEAAKTIAAEHSAAIADRKADMMQTFGLSGIEANYLQSLMDGRLKTKEALVLTAHENGEDVELKAADVYVHKLRKKLQTRLVLIETVWGQGYRMAPVHIARVMALLDEAKSGEARAK